MVVCHRVNLRAFDLKQDVQPRTDIQPGLLQGKTAADSLGILHARFVVSLFWPCSGSPPCVLMFGSLQRAAQMHFASFVSCGQGTTRRRTASTAAGKRTFKHHQMLRSSKQRQPLLHCQRVEAWQRIQKVDLRRAGGGVLFACTQPLLAC